MTSTVYHRLGAEAITALSPLPVPTLYAFRCGAHLAHWRARSFHGPDHEGSICKSGDWGDPLVLATQESAIMFLTKHPRALGGAHLIPITAAELIRQHHHQVSAEGRKFVPTSRAAAFLALTPEQQAGPEGREVIR